MVGMLESAVHLVMRPFSERLDSFFYNYFAFMDSGYSSREAKAMAAKKIGQLYKTP